MNDLPQMLLYDAFWSALAALGFAILFNVPRRTLMGCMLAGASGHALRTLCVQSGLTLEMGTLIGATLVGFMAVGLGNRHHVPRLIFSVSGVIPMVPGVFAYQTMLGLFDVVNAADSGAGSEALLVCQCQCHQNGFDPGRAGRRDHCAATALRTPGPRRLIAR